MKKIFALVIAVTTVGSVFAQSNRNWNDRDDHRDIAATHDRYDGHDRDNRYNNNIFTSKERDAQIKRINYAFDQRIKAVKRDRRFRSAERNRQVRQLEEQRRNEIREANERYARQNNARYNDRYDRNDNHRF